jgi:Family of unknown function (DUF5990)
MERQLPLRVTVVRPPKDVRFRLQSGRADLVRPVRETSQEISFDLSLRLKGTASDGPPNFLGPFAQGPPAQRFVYVNSGAQAGQADSCWDRRAKVKLAGLSWPLIEKALSTPGSILEARIEGTHRDGGPVCASVGLLDDGWRLVPADLDPE